MNHNHPPFFNHYQQQQQSHNSSQNPQSNEKFPVLPHILYEGFLPIQAQKKVKVSLYHYKDLDKVLQYNEKYPSDDIINCVHKIVKENPPPLTDKSNNEKINCFFETEKLSEKIKDIRRWCFGLTKKDISNIRKNKNLSGYDMI